VRNHVTVPQIGGMYRGDHAHKSTTAEFGFRLPPASTTALKFEVGHAAADHRLGHARQMGDGAHRRRFVEQVIRPTA
jgi:excinuclease ABC subunit B